MNDPSPRHNLRARLAERRGSLDAGQRIQAAQGLRRMLEAIPDFITASRIAGYWAVAGEIPLNLALASLQTRDQHYHLPVIGAMRGLRFAPWATGDEVQINRYGIPEPAATDKMLKPSEMDLVLVPLLGFDRDGHRLGHGGGFYDASFAFLRQTKRPTRPLLVGVGYAFQQIEAFVPQAWDVPMDYIATDRELIDCTEPPCATG